MTAEIEAAAVDKNEPAPIGIGDPDGELVVYSSADRYEARRRLGEPVLPTIRGAASRLR